MAILKDPYQHNSTRLYTALIGLIFSDIKIERKDGKIIRVPIAYSVKEKYDVRNNQNEDPNKLRIKQTLPRMSYTFTGWTKDDTRNTSKFNTLIKSKDAIVGNKGQYNRVAYTFTYDLNIKVKNIEDMLQIGEMIMAIFNPNIRVQLKDNPDLMMDSDVNIRLVGNNLNQVYEGSFEEDRVLELSFQFELDGWIYQPTEDIGLIQTIFLNYGDLDTEIIEENDIIE